MAEKIVRLCDRDGKEIHDNAALADLQGGPVQLRFPAFAMDLELCEECMDELYEHYGRHGRRQPGKGAALGVEQLKFLPFIPAQ